MERTVKKFGNSGHVVVPKKYVGKKSKLSFEEMTDIYMDGEDLAADLAARALKGEETYSTEELPALFSDEELEKMDVAKARKRPPYSDFSVKLKKEIGKFIDKFRGKKVDSATLAKFIALLNKDLSNVLKKGATRMFRKIYATSMDDVGKELNVNIAWGKVDSNAIEVLANQRVLSKAYQGITNMVTLRINKVIRQAISTPEKFTIGDITEQIKDVSDVADFRAENIARTETSKVSNAARINSYRKEDSDGVFKYKWIGPQDRRTTDLSKRIKTRTIKGVPYDDMVRIIKEESFKDFPQWEVNPDFPVSHYQSRHTFIRVG